MLKKMVITATLIASASAPTLGQSIDIGKIEYESNCAACHGIGAKGDGPVSKELKRSPADLTVIAKKNNGVFPVNKIYNTIDGRELTPSHGSREMPIWGYRLKPPHYNLKSADDYILSPPSSANEVVHSRILAIIDYLYRIQEK
jgi:mono/diheme cytochrome c family protein